MKFLSIASITLVSVIVVQALPNKLAELGEAVIQIGSKPKPSILKTNVKYASSYGNGILEEAQARNYLKTFNDNLSKPPKLQEVRDASGNVVQRFKPNEANEAWARHIEELSPNVVQTRRIQISDEVQENIIPARPVGSKPSRPYSGKTGNKPQDLVHEPSGRSAAANTDEAGSTIANTDEAITARSNVAAANTDEAGPTIANTDGANTVRSGVKHNIDSIDNPTDNLRPSKKARFADKSDELDAKSVGVNTGGAVTGRSTVAKTDEAGSAAANTDEASTIRSSFFGRHFNVPNSIRKNALLASAVGVTAGGLLIADGVRQ